MKVIKKFLLFCSGVDQSILKECPSDENKYVGIGGTIFFTGILAFFSAGYAIFTVFDNWFSAILFGIIWGLMIFNLDRYIVSSMKSRGSFWRDFGVAFPRLIMAILLALVISKPLELKIFEKEINAELITMEQEVFTLQETQLSSRFQPQIRDYQQQVKELQAEIGKKAALRDTLALMALQEADGTGGSMKKNLGPIYQAKKTSADHALAELEATEAQILPLIENKQAAILELESQMQTELAGLERKPYGGLAARMEALSRLGKGSQAIWFANIFIILLFIAIETAPIFVKLISNRSPYDFLLHQHEHTFEMANFENTSLLNNATKNKVIFDTDTGVYKVQAEIAAEKELIDYYLQQKKEAIKNNEVEWKHPILESSVIKE